MASSSVSQESLDREDIDTISTRRCKMRTSRNRCTVFYTKEREGICEHLPDGARDQNGEHHHTSTTGNPGDDLDAVGRMSGTTMTTTGVGSAGVDHESPTRATSRTKDKRTRPNHLHKGKPPKDKRKLREKRRSTGVVHLPSTESTGDSLDEEDDGDKVALETKRNTTYNEVIHQDSRNLPMPSDDHGHKSYTAQRTKSPSDLDADLEDNQDYDSAVSQSESNLTLVGQSDPTTGVKTNFSKPYRSSRSPYSPPGPSFPSGFRNLGSDHESKTPTYSTSSSSSSSLMNRNRENELGRHQDMSMGSHLRRDTRPHPSDQDSQQLTSYHSQIQDGRQQRSEVGGNYSAHGREKEPSTYIGRLGRENRLQGSQHSASQEEPADKLLDREREENRRLLRLINEKDRRIAELETEIALLNKDVEAFEDENQTLQVENRALINAFSQLSTTV